MSITFSPANNYAFCKANNLNTTRDYECQCVYDGEAYPRCISCKGTGKDTVVETPFEVNLANGNAWALLEMLGINPDHCGSEEPQKFLDGVDFVRSLNNCGIEPLVTPNHQETGENGCRLIQCGRTPDQVAGYLDRITHVAAEAESRGVLVTWG